MAPIVKNIYIPELISPVIKLNKIFPFQILHYELDTKTDWLLNLIKESSKGFDDNLPEEFSLSCNTKFVIKRLDSESLAHPVSCEGTIEFTIVDECIRCLTPVTQEDNISFNIVFIPSEFEKHEEIEDQEIYFSEGKEWDIVINDKQHIDFTDIFSELIQISIEPFPLHDENCKGLCQNCGADLNHESCKCSKKRN